MMNGGKPRAIDHAEAEERGLVEFYGQGKIDAETEMAFEAHFMECELCQEALEVEASFVRGLKAVAAEDSAKALVAAGWLSWLVRRGGLRALAVLLSVGAAIALALLLWTQNQQLEERLAHLEEPSGEGETLSLPLAGVPVALLAVQRGEEEAAREIVDEGLPFALAFDGGADPRVTRFHVQITDASGSVVFERAGLLPNDLEVVQLTFPTGFFVPGTYLLVARGEVGASEGASSAVELRFSFRMIRPGQ